MTSSGSGFETKAVHAGTSESDRERFYGAVTPPIFQTSTYMSTGREEYADIRYMRLNNSPTHIALNRKIAALEGAEDAMVMGSGRAAITCSHKIASMAVPIASCSTTPPTSAGNSISSMPTI